MRSLTQPSRFDPDADSSKEHFPEPEDEDEESLLLRGRAFALAFCLPIFALPLAFAFASDTGAEALGIDPEDRGADEGGDSVDNLAIDNRHLSRTALAV